MAEDKYSTPISVKIQNPLDLEKDKRPQKPQTSEITVKEFLDFLKTAYQVQDNLDGSSVAAGINGVVDWIKLKESELVKPKEISCQTSEIKVRDCGDRKSSTDSLRKKSENPLSPSESNEQIKDKLSEVLQEGLLDSVLPYLVPTTSQISVKRVPPLKLIDKTSGSSNSSISKENGGRKKSVDAPPNTANTDVPTEVEIHVCDEIKNTKKDFKCNQSLLIEKMGYFAEVTTGQKLEDMDISVHCDIGIFEWLMRWVKKDSLMEEDWPNLDSQNVIPILVSAAFLKMDPLLEECLLYCHEHMNDILRTNTNLSCLNDSVINRLAAKYTNTEVECIRDRKDKIQSRLFFKLLKSLIDPVPESLRGHWMSLAKVYRCEKCHQLLSPSVGPEIPCIPSNMRLQPDGTVTSFHVRDPLWNIKDYCLKMLKQLKTWRKVYWHLWGDAHFLYCTTCKKFFPAHQIGWCRYHPDPPQFFTVDAQKAPLPVGRFPCCGERAYRFQLLDNHSGCKFKEHTICALDVKESGIMAMIETYRHLVEEEPPHLMFPERLTRLVARDTTGTNDGKLECKEAFWWDGLQLISPRPKLGLLGVFLEGVVANESFQTDDYTEGDSSDAELSSSSSSDSTTSSSRRGSEESRPTSPTTRTRRKIISKPKKKKGRLWQQNASARSNQDMQRAYEETTMKKIVSVLCRRVSANGERCGTRQKGMAKHVTPAGGVWVRLESDWREASTNPVPQKMRNIYTGKPRVKATKLT